MSHHIIQDPILCERQSWLWEK